jgi:F0F1-type ATP synthase delta subunit
MTKKYIKELAKKSYDDKGNLQEKIVDTIGGQLNRADLKKYLNAIKAQESKKYVTITSAKSLSRKSQEELASLFPDKKIVYVTDPSLLAGIKIRTNDTEYEMSINSNINALMNNLLQQYD